MTPPVMLSKFLKPQEKIEPETDRYPLKSGDCFVLTDVLVIPSQKFGFVGKMNGYDIITDQKLKLRTTSKKVVYQLKELLISPGSDENGKLKTAVKVLAKETNNDNGKGLELVDPA
jgi:hypothetical protein